MKTTKMITVIAIACFLISGTNLQSQEKNNKESQTVTTNFPSPFVEKNDYKTAIGLRGGITYGLTLKHQFSHNIAIECILGVWQDALSITGLFEQQVPTGAPGLNWYYGGGLHATFLSGWRNYYYVEGRKYYYYYNNTDAGFGIDGLIGIEYKIPPIPFAISFDLKPFVEINTIGNVYLMIDPGLGIKVTF